MPMTKQYRAFLDSLIKIEMNESDALSLLGQINSKLNKQYSLNLTDRCYKLNHRIPKLNLTLDDYSSMMNVGEFCWLLIVATDLGLLPTVDTTHFYKLVKESNEIHADNS